MTEREFAFHVVLTLQQSGFIAYWAGGCVRDELLGLIPDDHDVATNATPEQVQKLFRHTVAIGASFGVIEVIGPKIDGEWRKVQVATFRSDGAYSDGRRPDAVTFSSAKEDAKRRDFTINGMFFDPLTGKLHDFVGGQNDLLGKILRAIGDPESRFEEDKLRILRAVRMATRFELTIDPTTLVAAKKMATRITIVSAERIAEELRKLFAHPRRVRGLELLREFGLVMPILPEIFADFELAIRSVSHLPAKTTFVPVLAVLLRTLPLNIAKSISKRWKLSNIESASLSWILTTRHSLHEPLTPNRIYPILAHPWFELLQSVARAIALADGASLDVIEQCEAIWRKTPIEILNPPPLLTGDDLIHEGWHAGPEFKTILEAVRSAQLDGKVNTPAQAISLARTLFS